MGPIDHSSVSLAQPMLGMSPLQGTDHVTHAEYRVCRPYRVQIMSPMQNTEYVSGAEYGVCLICRKQSVSHAEYRMSHVHAELN